MVDSPDEKLRKYVNSSGFPLQIGIKHAVKNAWRDQKWGVMAEEHPWKNEISGESGFIDLVLSHYDGPQILVVECKRVRDSQWIFLIPPNNDSERCTRARSWTTYLPNWCSWLDWHSDPASFEANFCVVPGQDPKAKPMLERTAATIVEATEAFAMEEKSLQSPGSPRLKRMYFSVIVTTADLKICRFDPAEVDIKSGEIAKCQFADVPVVRFRKSLTARNEEITPTEEIAEIFREKERTVFVVNSVFFLDFLKQWKLHDPPSILLQ
jgi:hypothetical protein